MRKISHIIVELVVYEALLTTTGKPLILVQYLKHRPAAVYE